MPIIIPTADELARMPWSARRHLRAQAVRALRDHLAEVDPEPVRSPRDLARLAFDADAERASAALALAARPPDPDAAEHRRIILEATR